MVYQIIIVIMLIKNTGESVKVRGTTSKVYFIKLINMNSLNKLSSSVYYSQFNTFINSKQKFNDPKLSVVKNNYC